MKGTGKTRRMIAAGSLTAALGVLLAVVVMTTDVPSLYLEGAEIRRMEDGSIQLLTTVSIEHVALSGGLEATMEYDPTYLTPSDVTTNAALVTVGGGAPNLYSYSGDAFYQVDENLYGGDDPFVKGDVTINTVLEDRTAGSMSGELTLDLQPENCQRTDSGELRHEKGKVYSFLARSENTTMVWRLAIDAAEKTPLIQLSFRVAEDKLPEIVNLFEGKQETRAKGASSTSVGTWDGNYLVRLVNLNNSGNYLDIDLPYWTLDSNNYYYAPDPSYGSKDVDITVSWNFEDTVIEAEAVEDAVTINAFEAYGEGTPADIAAALLRYSPTIRATHADGHLEDIVMDWGADAKVTGEKGGCYITTGVDKYHLTRAADGSYTVEKYDSGTDSWTTLTDNNWYDPRGGTYEVTQTLYYEIEGGTRKEYPYDIKVTLAVTPVTVTGVVAEDLTATYVTDGTPAVPGTYSGLGLPGTAQVTTDVVPGQISLTMPIQSWVSTEALTTDIAADLGNLTGAGPVTWPAVGTYAFRAKPTPSEPAYNETVIRAVYPWLTVPGSYDLDAVRYILAAGGSVPTFEIYYGYTDDSGFLTLKIGKKDADGNWVDMEPGDTFRLMLPNGTVIDDTWLASSGVTRTVTYGDGDAANDNKKDYTITLQGGTTTDKAKLTAASINLGGYFQVATTEPGKNESDFVGRYVDPRRNLYIRNYNGTDAFDFTGERAALYPFYRNSVLPDYVLLPAGYVVETTYDGLTGEEGGNLNRFKVDGWTYASVTNGTGTNGAWVPAANQTMTVSYGRSGGNYDAFAPTYAYPDYGTVVNPTTGTKLVQVNVEIQGNTAPAQTESVRLTYEGTGDTVTTHANGEAKRIIFDTQQVGYQYRQSVTLTLTNNGTTDITGIYIDNTGENAHKQEFVITQAPAENLPAGASTTFTVSYIWTLTNEDADSMTHRAIDVPIKIYSDNSATTPIKTFEAEFTVTRGPVYHLYVRTVPADGSLGTAAPVTGQNDHTPVGYTYAENSDVWLLATPAANQAVSRIYYVDGTDKICTLLNASATDKVNKLANFKMPAHDTVVYVEFEESIYSRLRLIDLQGWAGETPVILNNSSATGAGHQLPLMLHDSQDETVIYATDFNYSGNEVRTAANYTMTSTESTVIENEDLIQLTEDEYLVVIPADADYSQVRLRLRKDTDTSFWPAIEIWTDYGYGLPTRINDWSAATVAAAADSQNHTSAEFISPAQGERMKARITLKHDDEERTYTLIIARRLPDDATLAYPLMPGNSPYGMILWDWGDRVNIDAGTLTFGDTTQTRAAKTAYDSADRFGGMAVTPSKARNVLTRTYWQQAWSSTNYDKSGTALFVFAGEAFDDYGPIIDKVTNTAGDVIKNSEIRRTLTGLELLDDMTTTQKDQYEAVTTFAGSIDLGMADVTSIPANVWSYNIMDGENVVGTAVYKVRPGVYRLTYTYTDFDGQERSFYRPLIVLNRVGDLDQSIQADLSDRLTDKSLLDQRVTAPLGYEAAGYSDAALYRSRVCDANNDRNINQVDANTVLWNGMTQFYLPTAYKS